MNLSCTLWKWSFSWEKHAGKTCFHQLLINGISLGISVGNLYLHLYISSEIRIIILASMRATETDIFYEIYEEIKHNYDATRDFLLYRQKGVWCLFSNFSLQQICSRSWSRASIDQPIAFTSSQLVRPRTCVFGDLPSVTCLPDCKVETWSSFFKLFEPVT